MLDPKPSSSPSDPLVGQPRTTWPWQHFMLCCSLTAWFSRGLARQEPGLASIKWPGRDSVESNHAAAAAAVAAIIDFCHNCMITGWDFLHFNPYFPHSRCTDPFWWGNLCGISLGWFHRRNRGGAPYDHPGLIAAVLWCHEEAGQGKRVCPKIWWYYWNINKLIYIYTHNGM